MTPSYRLRKAHSAFLVSCRNLGEKRDYWGGAHPVRRWVLESITPRPLLNLLTHGKALAEALGRLERECKLRTLGEEVLRDYHRDVAPDHDGAYRSGAAEPARDSAKPPPAPNAVPLLMRKLYRELGARQKAWDAAGAAEPELLLEAVRVYHQIGWILPFRDANGRVARLAMNHLLRRYDGPYAILPPLGEAPELREALRAADGGDLDPLVAAARANLRRV